MSAPNASTCPQCGASLRCGAVSGDASCWCFDLPRVVAVPTSGPTQKAGCLCRACLEQLINSPSPSQTNSYDPKNLPAASD